MKKTLLALTLALASFQSCFAASDVFKSLSLAEAKNVAKTQNKILLIDFMASWCGPCHRMEADTWNNATVKKWVDDNAIAIQLDVDKDTQESAAFHIIAMPSVVAFTPPNMDKEFDRQIGYLNSPDIMEWLEGIKKGDKAIDLLKQKVVRLAGKGGEEEVKARFKLAHSLVELPDGKEGALENYLWLWQNIPTVLPAAQGERVSSIGNEIANLCRVYAPAKAKFETLRDSALAEAKYFDFVALNDILKDQKNTLDWFDKIKQKPDEVTKAKDADVLLERILINSDRWSDLLYLYPKPLDELKEREALSKKVMDAMQKRGVKEVYDTLPKDAAIIYVALLAAHKDSDAKKFAAEALKLRQDDKSISVMKKQFVVTALLAKQPRKDQRKWVLDDSQLLQKLDDALKPPASKGKKK